MIESKAPVFPPPPRDFPRIFPVNHKESLWNPRYYKDRLELPRYYKGLSGNSLGFHKEYLWNILYHEAGPWIA